MNINAAFTSSLKRSARPESAMGATGLTILAAAIFSLTKAWNVYVAAPGNFRIGMEEKITIATEGEAAFWAFEVFVQDYPGKIRNFSHTLETVIPSEPKIVTLKVNPSDVPNFISSDPSSFSFVNLVVHGGDFHKEVVLPISYKSGYVFLQTDKPIYKKKELVMFRILTLNEDIRPSAEMIKFQIKNPKGITVRETVHTGRFFITPEPYTFPSDPLLGLWTAIVLHGYKFQQNTSVQFELQEYVLPTFIVKLKVQEVILPSDETISISVEAKYVYGKPVDGTAVLRLGIKGEVTDVMYFAVLDSKKLIEGIYDTKVHTDQLKIHPLVGWFPESMRFAVEASVTEDATGKKEVAFDSNSHFSTSPFLISFKRCLRDFKPGLISVIEADVNYLDGRPAANIRTTISAIADGGIPVKITNIASQSNKDGQVLFEIQPETKHSVVRVTVKTDDPKFPNSQSVASHTLQKFVSKNAAYIAINRENKAKPKPGDTFTEVIYMEPTNMSNVYFLVASRGRIIIFKKLPYENYKKYNMHRIEFNVTQDMVPSFRLVVFAEYKGELIADSLRIDVGNYCDPKADIKVIPSFKTKEPGNDGAIIIEGSASTVVGLTAVDSAVYALSERDVLTKSKMFKTLEAHDLGCGPGGGETTASVLQNAGVVMLTRNYSPTNSPASRVSSCEEKTRKKREIIAEKLKEYDWMLRQCCALGLNRDLYNRGCRARAEIVKKHLQEENGNCSETFYECCLHGEKLEVSGMMLKNPTKLQVGRIGNSEDVLEFISEEDEQQNEGRIAQTRNDFRETWLFEEEVIRIDGTYELMATLPSSITTWIFQAVSISHEYGMCVATPISLEVFKTIFVQLNFPHSVVKNEQIEIRATVYNYGPRSIRVVVYMYGAKDLCTGIQEGQKNERKHLLVPSQSAETVSFPVIPLREGVHTIKVVALSFDGSDIVERELNVVAEGETVEQDITFQLDPSNQQRRRKRHIFMGPHSDFIDESGNSQVTAIKVRFPDDFIPGTESCTVSAIGDQFGPTVQTCLENPEELINEPKGCAEQTALNLTATLYTMRYLKITNKITAEIEEAGYEFIRKGYDSLLVHRKDDGSYGAFKHTPSSTWLTAFLMKLLCQASQFVHIDDEVIHSGVKWLVSKQKEDGSFREENPVYYTKMMGGVEGPTSITAFILITFEECSPNIRNLHIAKARALSYLEEHLGDINEPLPVAIAAYALALSESELKHAINSKLMALSKYDADTNTLFWETHGNSHDIEATGYGLLTQIRLLNMHKSNSIVNWLNTQRRASGAFKTTQDTTIGLQALSEYAIQARNPELNLQSNLTSSNDRNLLQTFTFNPRNAEILQHYRIDKPGGTLFFSTAGHGVGLLSVKLKYNVPHPPEKFCKFDVKVNVTQEKQGTHTELQTESESDLASVNLIRRLKTALDLAPEGVILEVNPRNRVRHLPRTEYHKETENFADFSNETNPRNRRQRSSRISYREAAALSPRVKKEDTVDNSNIVLRVKICTKYLGDHETGMAIVDAGIFSGFKVQEDDLKKLVNSPSHLIERYDLSNRGIVFYLKETPQNSLYCFSFRIIRDYFVGRTQATTIKVYSYYDPDESCTIFYRPDNDSPMLRKLCSGGICQCAEGGCPPKRPFANLGGSRANLKNSACEEHDYVWIVKSEKPIEKRDGFLKLKLRVKEVVKEGIEKATMVENKVRVFMARDNCATAELSPGKVYMIMGKDGKKYEDENGEIWHRYLLDQSSKIHVFAPIREVDTKIMRALDWLKYELVKGCDL